jgi:CBS domain-containing protein
MERKTPVAEVYISHVRHDGLTAEKMAAALRHRGCQVRRTGDDVPRDGSELSGDPALKAADVVLVLWSKASIDSHQLVKHAAKAARRRALISVLLDDVKPPLVLPPVHAVPVTDASGELTAIGLQKLLASICRQLDLPAPPFAEADRQPFAADAHSLAARLRPFEAGRSLIRLLDALCFSKTALSPGAIKKAQANLIEDMLNDYRPAPEVQQTLTAINNEMYRRLTANLIDRMSAEGWGTPPVPLTVIVMGSGGRGENCLFSDQDNGFILGDYPDSEHQWIDSYFRQLAERLCRRLNDAGLPFCNGYCMAANPLWRKSLRQWIEQVSLWVDKRNFVALRLAGLFFDFQGIGGDPSLAAALRRSLTRQALQTPEFLRQMLRELGETKVALNFFGTLRAEKAAHLEIGKLDLKHAGIVPLVEAARLLALIEGIEETSTLGRIAALRAAGKLAADEADELTIAFCVLTDVLLRAEVRNHRAGQRGAYALYPDAMTRRDKLILVDSLKATRCFRRRLRHQLREEREDITAT